MIHCRELVRYMLGRMDDRNPGPLWDKAQEHLEACPNCRVVVATTEDTREMYRRCLQPELPRGRRSDLLERLRGEWDSNCDEDPAQPHD